MRVPTLKLGQVWFDDLEEVRRQGQKFTREWVEVKLKILTELYLCLNPAEKKDKTQEA